MAVEVLSAPAEGAKPLILSWDHFIRAIQT